MRCNAVGYHHIHDSSFQKNRPGGSSDWLLLLVKTPAQFIIEGEIIHAKANSYMIYSLVQMVPITSTTGCISTRIRRS